MQLESLANRCCALQSEMMTMVGDDRCNIDTMNFTFMLWDHTASGVRMGCICDGGEDDGLLFIVNYDSPVNGKRLFIGTPWIADCVKHEQGRQLATAETVCEFLHQMCSMKADVLNTNVVFDGEIEVEKSTRLHLHFDHAIEGKSLLVKDVAECDNILLVIDMFQ